MIKVLAAGLAAGVLASSALAGETQLSYLAATCAACHGPAGGAIPGLADRPADKIAEALTAWRDGTRPGDIMPAVAAGLDDATIRALADHFAGEARP